MQITIKVIKDDKGEFTVDNRIDLIRAIFRITDGNLRAGRDAADRIRDVVEFELNRITPNAVRMSQHLSEDILHLGRHEETDKLLKLKEFIETL
jgi:hypothetical protein